MKLSIKINAITQLFVVAFILSFLLSTPASAQEMLANPSFEVVTGLSPAPINGNNFYATPPSWITTPANTTNIVKPWSGYANNSTATPTGGGSYYLDLNSAGPGTVQQSVIVSSPGAFNFSAWFSVRDFQQALTGCTIKVLNASNVVVATASTSFAATDPIGLWKQAIVSNVGLAAGTYTFQISLPDYANVDLTSFFRLPPLSITKTSSIVSDPINGSTQAKMIPGSIIQYCILATNSNTYTGSSVVLTDVLPSTISYIPNTMSSGSSCNSATTNPAVGASISGATITANIGTFASGASYAIVFNAQVH